MKDVAYSTLRVGDAVLHQLHTSNGRMFAMTEVAVELFHENPGAFGKDLRAGRYAKLHTSDRGVLRTLTALGVPVEAGVGGSPGCTLIPGETVEALLLDRRKSELVQPLRLALLKLASQEAARLMASGAFELALPAALDALEQGQALFCAPGVPAQPLQLFPLYLLAAQASLGLRRTRQCQDFLGLAAWLTLRAPGATTPAMRAQLARLSGQLAALQGHLPEAAAAFAEDVLCCAQQHGAQDPRTSLGFYNLAKAFQSQGETDKFLACSDMVVRIWIGALAQPPHANGGNEAPITGGQSQNQFVHAGDASGGASSKLTLATARVPLGAVQLREVANMLQDICSTQAECRGALHPAVGDACTALGLTQAAIGDTPAAFESLERACALLVDIAPERAACAQACLSQLQLLNERDME